MQPTSSPQYMWGGWENSRRQYRRRRVRLTLHDLRDLQLHTLVDWARLPRHQVTVYTPEQLRQLIRLDNSNGGRGIPYPTSDSAWRSDKPGTLWSMPNFLQFRVEPAQAAPLPAGGGAAPARRWEGAARGWAAGAVLLAVLILLVRAVEKCLHRKFFNARRRRSEEWPTPTVLATSNQLQSDMTIPSDTFHSDINEDNVSNDLPPPYSECANVTPDTNAGDSKIHHEEPPPPYSACYVAYSNPKDGIPSVHFYNRRRENIFENRTDLGHASVPNTAPIANRSEEETSEEIKPNTENSGCDQSDSNREFIFENGRIIEREDYVGQSHRNSGDGTVSNVLEVPENVIVDPNNSETVVLINESNSTNVPDRVLPV